MSHSLHEDSTKKLAFDFRLLNNLSSVEPINIKGLLYKLDILTVFMPLSKDFSGMSIKTDKYRVMLINSGHSTGRQNFTICHEFYHLYYQDDFSSMICNAGEFNKRDKVEYRADSFAAYLLLPEFGIIDLIPSEEKRFNQISMDTLLKIEHYYLCSRSALLYNLKLLGLIDSSYFDAHNRNVSKIAKQKGYSTDLYKPTIGNIEVIGDYSNLVNKRYQEELISESHFLTLLQDIGVDLENNSSCKNVEEPG